MNCCACGRGPSHHGATRSFELVCLGDPLALRRPEAFGRLLCSECFNGSITEVTAMFDARQIEVPVVCCACGKRDLGRILSSGQTIAKRRPEMIGEHLCSRCWRENTEETVIIAFDTRLIAKLKEASPTRDASVRQLLAEREQAIQVLKQPIPLWLTCPRCGTQHIDEGVFATKPHHTHTCQHEDCGLTWRPAVAPTVGVRFLPGFKNEEPA